MTEQRYAFTTGENEAAKNLNNAENVNTEFQEGVETSVSEEGENVEGVDAAVSEGVHPQEVEQPAENVGNQVDPNIESESDASSVSDCPSWIDANDDDELRSLRGSDDDSEVYEMWNDDMERRKSWDVKFLRSEKRKVTAICKNGCGWRIHASPIMSSTTYQIKSIKGQHFCNFRTDNKQATYKYIGKRIQHFINDNPNEGLVSLKNKIRRDVQIECSLHKVYRAKRYAVELLRGDLKEQYNKLFDYCATVLKHSPNSHLVLKLDKSFNPPVLSRMYCCLSGLRDGFLDGCRPIIGLDGCFLKGLFKGQLLCAVDLLIRDIGSAEEKGWAFLSDRQKGLIDVVHSVAPRAEHRFCVRHLYNNFKGMFKDEELKRLFWKAASTYSVKQHLRIMK
ncbi:hypothetical protein BUALT_Bualt19G0060400 [Buddleja alternifolia]|uniref:Transposase n=1 Tax=Buddleja alternifolia TaxID=168488 RepID=A0AAV6W2G2_9LAMI|nr:hypothetical protein BUALT_Bualt19G0060400 [Buddleja alternifolia]